MTSPSASPLTEESSASAARTCVYAALDALDARDLLAFLELLSDATEIVGSMLVASQYRKAAEARAA